MSMSIPETLNQAAKAYQSGDIARAGMLCQAILDVQSDQFSALLLLAMVEHRQQRYEDALRHATEAVALNAGSAQALAQQALTLTALQDYQQALASYDQALQINPQDQASLFNRANLLQKLERYQEALAGYDRVITLNPGDAAALNNRGVALYKLDRFQEALDSYARSLDIRPGSAETFNNRGNALQALDFNEEAVASYQQALEIDSEYAEAYNNLGNAQQALGRQDEALGSYGQAIRRKAGYSEAYNNRAALLLEMENYQQALADAERALQANPDYPEALSNKGNALEGLGRHEEALQSHLKAFALLPGSLQALNVGNAQHALGQYEDALMNYDMALTIKPDYAEAYNNRGNTLQALNRFEAALHHYQKATELRPDDAEAHWNEALASLTLGDYRRGWEKYEWRWRNSNLGLPEPVGDKPQWSGEEDISGKTVLLYTEQGFGDAIQFARYIPLVASRGGRVLVACHQSLRRLFETVEGTSQTVSRDSNLPDYDFQAALMSMPLAFGTRLRSIPGKEPYITADKELAASWRSRIESAGDGKRVGIVWAGNPDFAAAKAKAVPVDELRTLLDVPGLIFYSLQKGEAASKAAALMDGNHTVFDYTEQLHDFADTAALISNLDLVITVDTAVAHLAGALGKAVWILLPYSADWRWLVDRDDSLWYPSARLFRQQQPGDWEDPIARIKQELQGNN